MNILLVSSKYMPEYSGSGFRAHNLYKRLLQKKDDINLNILCSSTEHNSNTEYDYDGFKVTRIACKKHVELSSGFLRKIQVTSNFKAEKKATLNYLGRLSEKPDLIHIFGKSYVTATVLDYARKNNIPAIIELCNEMDTPFQFVPFFNRLGVSTELPESYIFVCISEMLKKMALKNGISEENIWCRPNPVDEKRFHPVEIAKKIELRQKLSHFSKDDFVVSYIAKFRPSKNHRFLIDVMSELPPEYKLVLGGPLVDKGPEGEKHQANYREIEKKIEDRKLGDRIRLFADFVENIEEYYQMSNVFAFPTLNEALGTPMLESIACATPVVANNLSGVTDAWIKDAQNGYLSSMDAKEFADKIKQACQISRETMLNSGEELILVAGTDAIDKQYLKIIETLTRQ
jgi:glycosyltransferase involved in cell wall biosynthesis